MIINFENRLEVYLSDNYDNILSTAVPLTSKIISKITPYTLQIQMPIVEGLQITKYANTFVSLVLNLILGGLLFLAGYVIYNIMLISIDSKVYETAVKRTIGLTQR